jgi:hypothetical protein
MLSGFCLVLISVTRKRDEYKNREDGRMNTAASREEKKFPHDCQYLQKKPIVLAPLPSIYKTPSIDSLSLFPLPSSPIPHPISFHQSLY